MLDSRSASLVAARLRALSAARLAVTVFLGGCGGELALLEHRAREVGREEARAAVIAGERPLPSTG